jgi:hypothetical protein
MNYELEIGFQLSPEEIQKNHDLFKRYLEEERLGPLDFGLVKRLLELFGGSVYIQDFDPTSALPELKIMINLPAIKEKQD